MADEITDQDYDSTVDENMYLFDVAKKYSSTSAFLSRDEKIYVRSIKLDTAEAAVWLQYETDIDGCVIELSNICGISFPIHHITLCSYEAGSLKELKSVLKKHIDLKQFNRDALSNFNHSVGFQLFYEQGWECWFGLIPKANVHTIAMPREIIRAQALQTFQSMRKKLSLKLFQYAQDGVALQTISKNDLTDLRRLFILPGDLSMILNALQGIIGSLEDKYFRPILFCFRFGEKMKAGISLAGFDLNEIQKVTVHAAVDISSSTPGIELLWSAEGVQQLVGQRGTLSTCLSLNDCVNFQSNLDGRRLDVKADLLRLFICPERVTFVQLYADIAHLKPKSRFHPVSGVIVGGLCFPHKTSKAFHSNAEVYVSVLKQNFCLLQKSSCRLEIAGEVEVSSFIKASDCISEDRLNLLVQTKPLLVPVPSESIECIRYVGLWLSSKLEELLRDYANTGNVNATWHAFQYELACEKILWGRPLCWQSALYSVNLGPGQLGPSRSRTDHLGFIALDSPTTCMHTEDSLPPYKIWTASEAVGKSITRACGIHDHLDASNPVLGRLLLLALLKDFHEVGKASVTYRFPEFLSGLKSAEPGCGFRVVGSITIDSLVELLTHPRRCQLHMVFGSLCKLLVRHRLSLKEIVQAGFKDLGLSYFPAFNSSDVHRNSTLTWTIKKSFWKIEVLSNSAIHTVGGSADLYSRLSCCELERRGLVFPSKLKKLSVVWPWIQPCLAKLEQEKLREQQLITTLSFVSAIAFAMSGMFVDYERLYALHQDLPFPQFRLKALEIQSKMEMPKYRFQNLILYKLHPSIPHKIELNEQTQSIEPLEPQKEIVPDIDSLANNKIVQDDDVSIIVNCAQPRPTNCQPVGSVKQRAWSSREIELLYLVCSCPTEIRDRKVETVQELYSVFRANCLKECIPVRTFISFKHKVERLFPRNPNKDKIA